MKTINAHEAHGIVDASASVRVGELPFATGDRVRVFVLGVTDPKLWHHTSEEIRASYRIRKGLNGVVTKYDRPDEPVGVEDWDMLDDTPGKQ